MSLTIKNNKKMFILSVVTAAMTVIAGILHLQMAPRSFSENLGQGILFLVGGVVQIFWAVPVIKQWGKIWQIIGIGGTIVFFVLWYASRLHLISENIGSVGGTEGHGPREFPRGNFTQGEFPRNSQTGDFWTQFSRTLPAIEIFQLAFIGLYSTMSIMISKRKKT